MVHAPAGGGGGDADADAAFLGELEGIGQHVADHLQQTLLVGPDAGGQRRRHVDGETERAAFGDWPEGPFDLVAQVGEQGFVEVQGDGARFDLGQVEDLVDQFQQVLAGAVDGLGVFDLLGREVAVRVATELMGEDQQAVQRGPEFVGHAGEKLGLVPGRQHQLLGLFLQRQLGEFDFAVLALDFGLLFRQQPGLVLQLLVGLAQLFLLELQFLGEQLRLLEQLLGAHVGFDGVEHDADRLGELVQEHLVDGAVGRERGHLDDRLDLGLEEDREHDDIQRGGGAQA
ncbi:hypothetical protein D9M68_496670 [compost metagenome]